MEEAWEQTVFAAREAKEDFNDFHEDRLVIYAADRIADLETQLADANRLVVSGFYEERIPMFRQGTPRHELEGLVSADDCSRWVNRIADLETQLAAAKAARESEHRCELWRQQCDAEIRTRQEEQLAEERAAREAAERRADELAAHCERLREAILYAVDQYGYTTQEGREAVYLYVEEMAELEKAANETPRASLAHHDAQVMREAAKTCFEQQIGLDADTGDFDKGYIQACFQCASEIEARADEIERDYE